MTFEEATIRVKALTAAPDPTTLLRLYGLFKQGGEGDATGERPGALDFRGRAKFDAWKALAGMAPEAAQAQYVALVEELLAKDA